MPNAHQIEQLANAACQVLDDMGADGLACCGLAKAALRIAIEPFLTGDRAEAEAEVPLGMSMEAALTLFKDVNNA
jgi:hypothetical protein